MNLNKRVLYEADIKIIRHENSREDYVREKGHLSARRKVRKKTKMIDSYYAKENLYLPLRIGCKYRFSFT